MRVHATGARASVRERGDGYRPLNARARTVEQRAAGDELGKDAANAPNIDRGGVVTRAQEDLGRAVPQGDHLVGVAAHGDAKRAGQTKVGQLERALAVNEQVVRLEVAVQHAPRVAIVNARQQLVQIALPTRAPGRPSARDRSRTGRPNEMDAP
jgi:hypothetical protein